jgi:hypothetical protein
MCLGINNNKMSDIGDFFNGRIPGNEISASLRNSPLPRLTEILIMVLDWEDFQWQYDHIKLLKTSESEPMILMSKVQK